MRCSHTLLLAVPFVVVLLLQLRVAHGADQANKSSKPSALLEGTKEIEFANDRTRWLAVHTHFDGIQTWVTEQHIHRVLVNSKGSFDTISSFEIPREYQSKVASFSWGNERSRVFKLLLIPAYPAGIGGVGKSHAASLVEVSLALSLTLGSGPQAKWRVLRELALPSPKGSAAASDFGWKSILVDENLSVGANHPARVNHLFLVAKDKIIVVDYNNWKVIDARSLDNAEIMTAATLSGALYIPRYTPASKTTEIYRGEVIVHEDESKSVEWQQVADASNSFHGLHIVAAENNRHSYFWLRDDVTDASVIESASGLLSAGADASFSIQSNISILFGETERQRHVVLAFGPLEPALGRGGYILRRMSLWPTLAIDKEDERLVDYDLLPTLAVQLSPKGTVGRMVFGTLTQKGVAKLALFSYKSDKLPDDKKTTPTPTTTTTTPNALPVQITGLVLPAAMTMNATSVPSAALAPLKPNGRPVGLPFSCHEQGCGPDVQCPQANPSRQCFLYNDEFLCCHQSPF